MDVERQVRHWRESALDDLEAAAILLEKGKVNQGLFFAHLALEKSLKALVCRSSQSTPPFIHSLPRLAEQTGIEFSAEQNSLLARLSAFQLRGRYELPARPLIAQDEIRGLLHTIEEFVRWITTR